MYLEASKQGQWWISLEVEQKYLKNVSSSHSFRSNKAKVPESKRRRRLAMSNYLTDDCSHQKKSTCLFSSKKNTTFVFQRTMMMMDVRKYYCQNMEFWISLVRTFLFLEHPHHTLFKMCVINYHSRAFQLTQ